MVMVHISDRIEDFDPEINLLKKIYKFFENNLKNVATADRKRKNQGPGRNLHETLHDIIATTDTNYQRLRGEAEELQRKASAKTRQAKETHIMLSAALKAQDQLICQKRFPKL